MLAASDRSMSILMGSLMINLDSCVVCGITEAAKLNTEFKITVDDKQIIVKVCDTHADDITVKAARDKYNEKMAAINTLMEQAKSLGFSFDFNKTIATSERAPEPVKTQIAKPVIRDTEPVVQQDEDAIIINDLSKLDRVKLPQVQSIGQAQTYQPIDITQSIGSLGTEAVKEIKQLTNHGSAKVKLVEGRGRVQIPIPVERRDGLGTTRININNTMTDAILQEQFKSSAQESKEGRGYFAQGGYEAERQCSLCRGRGQIRAKGGYVECPKCEGSGVIQI